VAEISYRQSPLAHLGFGGRIQDSLGDAGIGISERDYRAILDLRVQLDKEPEAQESFKKATGITLPETANTFTAGEGIEALWLGPNEWQIVAHDNRPEAGREWTAKVQDAMKGHFCAVVNISNAQGIVGLTGPEARDVLERAVPLDMDARAFKPGEVKQTLFGKGTSVTIQLRDEAPTFDIYCRRSFAEYVWRYLEDCAKGACAKVAVLPR
jgi:sarcosine oxidase subunit gamma